MAPPLLSACFLAFTLTQNSYNCDGRIMISYLSSPLQVARPKSGVFSRKSSEKVEQKDRVLVRPRQVRYQAALRRD
jgi:hypothetical protein